MPDAVDTVVSVSDDGWKYHPKHIEHFPDKVNCVTLQLVGYILEQSSLTLSNQIFLPTAYSPALNCFGR
jgi:hypothetical protein